MEGEGVRRGFQMLKRVVPTRNRLGFKKSPGNAEIRDFGLADSARGTKEGRAMGAEEWKFGRKRQTSTRC